MQIIPTLELQKGKCVSLTRGNLDQPMIWHVDPVETAQGFAGAGASMMRVTDFDAIEGADTHHDLIEEIIRTVGIPVQVAGGIRSAALAQKWVEAGAGQVVIGSMATYASDAVKELAKFHPDQVVLSIDVWQGKLMADGWRTETAIQPGDFLRAFDDAPLAGIVVTDIDSDIDEVDAKLGVISGLAAESRLPIIASGTVQTLDDIARLKYVPNIAGALVGRALFNKSVDLAEALEIAKPQPEKTAEFQ